MQDAFDFSAPTGDDLKREALDGMEVKHLRWIDEARLNATVHAAKYGRVSINDIRFMIKRGVLSKSPHCNVMGTIFHKGFREISREPVENPAGRNRGGGVAVWGLA
jgi:hypothetical protein